MFNKLKFTVQAVSVTAQCSSIYCAEHPLMFWSVDGLTDSVPFLLSQKLTSWPAWLISSVTAPDTQGNSH